MTRDEFIHQYWRASDMEPDRIEGERQIWNDGAVWLALQCRCGEDGCEGWAMVPQETQGWHLFQNASPGEGPSYEEAIAMDRATRARLLKAREAARITSAPLFTVNR